MCSLCREPLVEPRSNFLGCPGLPTVQDRPPAGPRPALPIGGKEGHRPRLSPCTSPSQARRPSPTAPKVPDRASCPWLAARPGLSSWADSARLPGVEPTSPLILRSHPPPSFGLSSYAEVARGPAGQLRRGRDRRDVQGCGRAACRSPGTRLGCIAATQLFYL
jgi:hypothetical protein